MKYLNTKLQIQKIAETDKYSLVNSYESTYIIEKSSKQILFEEDFYGDPECGLIDKDNNWVMVGGTHLLFWKPTSIRRFQTKEFKNVHSMRVKSKNVIEILIDPWSESSAIWELNIKNERLTKISEFNRYRDKEFVDNVNW